MNLPPRTSNTDPAAPWNQHHEDLRLEDAELGPMQEIQIKTNKGKGVFWLDEGITFDRLVDKYGEDWEVVHVTTYGDDIWVELVVGKQKEKEKVDWRDWAKLFD